MKRIILYSVLGLILSVPATGQIKKKPMPKLHNACGFERFLNDPGVPQLAKNIAQKVEWDQDDSTIFNFLDSLTAKDLTARPFYFRVVTNSDQTSNGYYTVALGQKGTDFVREHTQEFLANFDNGVCFPARDLKTWANIVLIELALNYDTTESRTVINTFFKKLEENCASCTPLQQTTLKQFYKILKYQYWGGPVREDDVLKKPLVAKAPKVAKPAKVAKVAKPVKRVTRIRKTMKAKPAKGQSHLHGN